MICHTCRVSQHDPTAGGLASLVDRLDQVAVCLAPDGTPTFVALGIEALTGVPRDELIGGAAPWLDLVHDDDREGLSDARARAMAGEGLVEHRYRLRHRDTGALRCVRERWWPVAGPDGALQRVEGLVEDRTLALAREIDEARRHRREILGRMTGGVAHGFNNLLTVISGYASALHGNDKLDALEQRAAEQITVAADRATDQTRRLVRFQHGMPGRVEPVHVLHFLKETRDLISGMISRAVEIKVVGQRDLPELLGDDTRLQEAVLHLVANASEAMPQGGTLTLAVFPEEQDGASYLVLEVRDTGEGMLPEVRDRVFEPFFTTREDREDAVGLGCTLAAEAVRAHGGAIRVESTPGEGTTFALRLPAAGVADEAQAAEATSKKTVFLVENRGGVRSTLVAGLEAAGLRVQAFEDVMALAKHPADAQPRPDALAIGDPGGGSSGGMLLRGVAAAFRDMPLVIYDVDPTNPVGEAAVSLDGAQLLGAPLDPERVASAMREALEGA